MDAGLSTTIGLMKVSDGLFLRAIADITREQGLARIGPDANPLIWIAAHLTSARAGMAQMAGLRYARPWGSRFGRGTHEEDLAKLPQLDEVRSAWQAATAALAERLPVMTQDELDARAPRDFPIDDKSVRGAFSFLAYHEAYHIGQMALIRKTLGLGGLVG
jgi:hypothetical protein